MCCVHVLHVLQTPHLREWSEQPLYQLPDVSSGQFGLEPPEVLKTKIKFVRIHLNPP